MWRFWDPVIAPLLDAAGARAVMEIGVDHGRTTRLLLDRAVDLDGGIVHAVDPAPACNVDELRREYGDALRFHRQRSVEAIPVRSEIDAILIDGDHNWFTVSSELKQLDRATGGGAEKLPLVIAHDVGWPYGRRDMYYEPDRIPEAFRHPSKRSGVVPGRSDLDAEGMNPWLWNAEHEGGPRNGVLTAIEDFMSNARQELELTVVDGFHGLGILAGRALRDCEPGLHAAIARLRSPQFARTWARRLERARVEAELDAWRARGSARPPDSETARWERGPA